MAITRTVEDGVAVLHLDDGRVNAFDLAFFDELDAALDDCDDDRAVVLAGREGVFSAGLNTKVLPALDDEGFTHLLEVFGRTMLRVWLHPRPTVAAATGHAVAGGTLLAMACDHAVAAAGEFRWGLSETSIGFALPGWALVLARANVRTDRLEDLVLPGRLVLPDVALEAGFVDEVVAPDEVVEVALRRARELAELPTRAYAANKERLRGPAAGPVLAGIAADARSLLVARGT